MNKYVQLTFVIAFGIFCGFAAVQLNHLRPDYNPITGEYSNPGAHWYQKAQVQGEFLGDVPRSCSAIHCDDGSIRIIDPIQSDKNTCIPEFIDKDTDSGIC